MELKVVATDECTEHRHDLKLETWIVCTHTGDIASGRYVESQHPIVGEALCPDCMAHVNAGRPDRATLRLACGACVRTRWPLELPGHAARIHAAVSEGPSGYIRELFKAQLMERKPLPIPSDIAFDMPHIDPLLGFRPDTAPIPIALYPQVKAALDGAQLDFARQRFIWQLRRRIDDLAIAELDASTIAIDEILGHCNRFQRLHQDG